MISRLKEPSTWGGIGVLLMALNQIFDINEAGIVGEAVIKAAPSGDLGVTVGAGLAALLGIFLTEVKGGK